MSTYCSSSTVPHINSEWQHLFLNICPQINGLWRLDKYNLYYLLTSSYLTIIVMLKILKSCLRYKDALHLYLSSVAHPAELIPVSATWNNTNNNTSLYQPFSPWHQYIYSPYCSLYIPWGADEENLFHDPELL